MFNLFRNVSMNFYSPAEPGGGASSTTYLDKTWQEIYDAVADGKDVSVISVQSSLDGFGFDIQKFQSINISDLGSDYAELGAPARYLVELSDLAGNQPIFMCSSPNDYPELIDFNND